MRGLTLVVSLTLALASHAAAQTGLSSIGIGRSGGGVRSGGGIQGGPGRITRPGPALSPSAPSQVKVGVPDARLGAGSIRPNTGNVVYPGTPGNNQAVGNILSPGLPSLGPVPSVQPIPSVVQPAQPSRPEHRRPGHHRPPRSYPVYGIYAYPLVPNVIAVTGSTITQSGAGYVITVGDEPEPELEPGQTDQIETEQVETEAVDTEKIEPDYWLIALQGGLIYAVSDYAVEGRALRFVTLQGDEYVVPLAELDVDFTTKLNRDRGVEIEL